jgi:hypothetical protein
MASFDSAAPIPLPSGPTVYPPEITTAATIMNMNETTTAPIMYLQEEKLGTKCCGCLCDYRRAVIWSNSFWIGWATFLLLSRGSVVQFANENFDDDVVANEVSIIVDDYYRKRSISLGVVLATAFVSQIGAVAFWASLVALHALALMADFTAFCFLALELYRDLQVTLAAETNQVPASPVISFLVNGAITLLCLYPQVGFLLECRLGIMTAATYPREDYSCCCSAAARPRPAPFPANNATTMTTLPEQYPTPPSAASGYILPTPAPY